MYTKNIYYYNIIITIIREYKMGNYYETFKKGNLEMLLLKMLSIDDCYGYEFTQLFSKISNEVLKLSPATMYPALYRLEQKGLIESYEKAIGKRMKQIYYHLTETGQKELNEMMRDYEKIVNATNAILAYEKRQEDIL